MSFAEDGEVEGVAPRARRSVLVVAYDPAWPEDYGRVRGELRESLGADAQIHHIGSTSVPGLPAKPVIDVLVAVPALAALERATPSLVASGYEARGEYGIVGRRYFSRPPGTDPAVHVHSFEHGHEQIDRHLLVRDFLRARADRAAAYGALKRELAARHSADRDAYQAAKADFVEAMHAEAIAWRGRRRPPIV